MPYQQPPQPGPFRITDEIEAKAHTAIGPVCAVIFGVAMFFYGLDHPRYPLIVFIGPGIIGGLLIVALLKHTIDLLIYAALVCGAGFGTFWLFEHTAELRERHAAPAVQTAPASPADTSRGLLDDLKKAVQ